MVFHYRSYALACIAYLGALLFGYDTGVAGGVIALPSFQYDFGLVDKRNAVATTHHDKKRVADLSANVVSVLQAGAFFGALAAAPLTDRLGRKPAIAILCVIFMIGGIIQTAANGHLGAIYAGRVVAGLGVGGLSTLSPTFVAECAPKQSRGRISGLFQLFVVTGVAISYWTTYGVKLHVATDNAAQWRIPFGVQIIPGGLLFLGLFLVKESPRWLARKGRNDEALRNLAYLRHADETDPAVLEEFAEIRASIDAEIAATEGVTFKEIFAKGNRIRFFIGFTLMTLQQWGGQNIVNYYAPSIFQSIGISSANSSLFASGIYGLIKIASTAAFLLIGIEQFGRKLSLGFGGLGMGTLFFIVGAIGLTHPPDPKKGVSSSSIAMAAMIYLFSIVYSFSWGPVPWVYSSEIFPNRLRAMGIGFTAATQWIMNFALSRTAPIAEVNLGFRLFITFGAVNIFNGFVGFLLPETRGRSLEEMDVIFGFVSKEDRAAAVQRYQEKDAGDAHSLDYASSKSMDEKSV
ncbi:general substrate transporter, partial [Atractiella rhizophila]